MVWLHPPRSLIASRNENNFTSEGIFQITYVLPWNTRYSGANVSGTRIFTFRLTYRAFLYKEEVPLGSVCWKLYKYTFFKRIVNVHAFLFKYIWWIKLVLQRDVEYGEFSNRESSLTFQCIRAVVLHVDKSISVTEDYSSLDTFRNPVLDVNLRHSGCVKLSRPYSINKFHANTNITL